MADLSRTYTFCTGTYWKCEDPNDEAAHTFTNTSPVAVPWFTQIGTGLNFQFTAGAIGTYTIEITGSGDTGVITIIVIDCGTKWNRCPEESDQNIAWLNPAGGWSTYVFQGITVKGYDVGKVSTIKDSNKVLKMVERIGIYNTIVCDTGPVPKNHIDYLDTLRYGAIQAYLYNTDTEEYDIPIILEPVSFPKYASKDQLFKASVKFKIATEINVQGQ